MKRIYFDHSATTPVDKEVLEEMMPYFSDTFGNASSIHNFGQSALAGVDQARAQTANFLNCKPKEVIFTSGATESDNLAVKGLIKALKKEGIKKMHAITSLVEHDAVLQPFAEISKEGVDIDHAPVKANGVVDLEKFKKMIKDNTVLVSIMYVNSEVGAIMPVREIAKIIKKTNEKRLREWKKLPSGKRGDKPQRIYFHTDATQAVNFCNCDVEWNYFDLLSLSGHKIYGPKGVGALYCREGVPLAALQRGGHHENDKRSGTLNVSGIVGLGKALERVTPSMQKKNNTYVAGLRDLLVKEIIDKIPDVVLNTDRKIGTPSHAHFSFLGVEGESILIALDLKGIAVSTGSACASGSLKASHVLIAMGIKKEIAHNSIRFTLGKHNTEVEIKKVVSELAPIVERLRKMSPVYKK